ncbi:MAG TPA: LuxR family transcriptional regulator [Xanthobacteraceae bacterium]|jgi:LuxR family quorum sensing-dependent transcriptional regulator|nr:LuxR family transcriptional regulator [Xanthobacteraceae bacterium]
MPTLGQDDRYWAVRALDFVDAANVSESPDSVMSLFGSFIGEVGYDSYVMVTLPDNKTVFERRVIVNGWKSEWTGIYTREKLQDYDPVARHSVRMLDPYYWNEAPLDTRNRALSQSVMQRARDFGMHEGLCVPIHSELGLGAAISIAGRQPDTSRAVKAALHLIALYTHNRVRVLLRPPAPQRPALLSGREREVLQWVAAGKTNQEVGMILNITERTVRFHLETIAHKLETVNRMTSVARAVALGEIELPE